MLHGVATNLAFWFFRILPPIARRFRVTAYDLRGHGRSEITPRGYTTREQAEDLVAVLDALGIGRPHLVAHSLGAAVALHAAVLFPQRVASLTLMDFRVLSLQPIRHLGDEAFWKRRREELEAKGVPITPRTPPMFYAMLEEIHQLAQSGTMRSALVSALGGNAGPKPAVSRAGKRWEQLLSATSFAEDVRDPAGLTPERIREVKHAALLMYGAASFFLESGRAIQPLLAQGRLVVHPGVGHFFPLVQPERAVEPTLAFLGEQRSR
jgi:pimeloyl-ACP methyl ester carboxylesterase